MGLRYVRLTGVVPTLVLGTTSLTCMQEISEFQDPDGWNFHKDIEENYGQVVKIRGLLRVSTKKEAVSRGKLDMDDGSKDVTRGSSRPSGIFILTTSVQSSKGVSNPR
ncbi:hypothetical protein C8R44DRAFT_725532 [Mycena epipterygia]|nr:hypothetical protein C8R44DRAFT_725532 [Mycena epipterygia]